MSTSFSSEFAGTTMRSASALSTRALRNTRRLPSTFLPTLAMPIFQSIAFAGTFLPSPKFLASLQIAASTGTCRSQFAWVLHSVA